MSKNTDASNQYPPDQELSSDPMKAGGFISFIKREMGLEDRELVHCYEHWTISLGLRPNPFLCSTLKDLWIIL